MSDGPTCPNNKIYGLVTIGINWLPGVVAAVHLISMYRTKQDCRKTVLWACKDWIQLIKAILNN